jgi:hypothetical protein
MRYVVLLSIVFLAACSPRMEASRQCYRDAGGMSASMAYGYGSVAGSFFSDSDKQAYRQSMQACMDRYDMRASGE